MKYILKQRSHRLEKIQSNKIVDNCVQPFINKVIFSMFCILSTGFNQKIKLTSLLSFKMFLLH